jgi:hypothetical protein
MNAVSQPRVRSTVSLISSICLFCTALTLTHVASAHDEVNEKPAPKTVRVRLSEWKVELTPNRVPPGPVLLEATNVGTVPHALEIEGGTLEKTTPQIQPDATVTLKLDLRAGSYETYCPVGKGSHKMLGMMNRLTVGNAKRASAANDQHGAGEHHAAVHEMETSHGMAMAMEHDEDEKDEYTHAKMMKVIGGGPVIQILPGPFPFADSAAAVIRNRPADQQEDLNHKAQLGPYSNNVANITGDISLVAIDRGAAGDSVSGLAQFTGHDGARWKVVMDRVQTRDIPFNPRFGGVIMGLFYHGASGVHTPLVPTIQSSLALWAFAHLYKNDQLVTDNAMVHIMLLSRTRRTDDWALDCWDCSDRPIEELQLQVTPAPNTPAFDSPGGFLFVNWEKSAGQRVSS